MQHCQSLQGYYCSEFSSRIVLPLFQLLSLWLLIHEWRASLFSFWEINLIKRPLSLTHTHRERESVCVVNVLPGQLLWYAYTFSSHIRSKTGVDWWWRWGMTSSSLWLHMDAPQAASQTKGYGETAGSGALNNHWPRSSTPGRCTQPPVSQGSRLLGGGLQ